MEFSLAADLKNSYGIVCHKATPVTGGYMNQKWKVSSNQGDLLVKQFSPERFDREKLKSVESALQRQIILAKNGGSCPAVWTHQGRAIRLVDEKTAYMVMDFLPGKMETPATSTSRQLYTLGGACGFMHKTFSRLPVDGVKGYPIEIRRIIVSLWNNFYARRQDCFLDVSAQYQKAVLDQEAILKQLTTGFFDRLPQGIAHEDFSGDNILFLPDGISAIVDFDRSQYSFVWHDIGRVLLSLTLEEERLNLSKIQAFLDGYSEHLPLNMQNIADALRLCWYLEIPWWIQPKFFREDANEKTVRFKNEMLWLTKHWKELDTMLGL